MSAEDYNLARGSTLNAHYTSKTVIDAIYKGLARMGFTDGVMLEPACGTGNFIGLMPDTFKNKVYGVELDNITGRIAKHLYPNADIQIKGFEDTSFPDGYFDGAATNVPFGSYSVFDPKYDKHNLYIHDYFILKTLDKLREGGVAAIVTSKGTLDKANAGVRRLIAERARLLGAVRLPNNAFKANAGTEVTADILFFRKVSADTQAERELDWIDVGTDANGVPVNGYYLAHPETVLGTMKQGKSMYGNADETYCEPDGRELKDALAEAIQNLPENVYASRAARAGADTEANEQAVIPADLSVRNYCYAVLDNKIYMRVDNEMVLQNVPPSQELRLKGLIGLRRQVRNLLDVQLDNCTDWVLEREQERLNAMYGRFVRQYGALNTKTNRNLFREDADYTLLISLESYDEASGAARKTDIFSKRTIRKYTRPTHAGTALEALQISKNETGRVSLKIIGELTGKGYEQITAELDGHIYRNPELVTENGDRYGGWETASEYLSGNVRRKLDFVSAYAQSRPEFTKNIAALERVQPAPLSASEISVRIGMGWIAPEIYKQFLCERFHAGYWDARKVRLSFNPYTQSWKLEAPPGVTRSFESANVYGTERMNGCVIFEHAINLQTPSVFDKTTDADGKERRVLNKPQTIAVREKLRKIQEEFKAWVFDEPDRREELVRVYNERFNNITLAAYDGGYLTFPEMNPLIELKPYQKDAVERIVTAGNTLLHHVVGAGKTYEIAAAAMKLRQLKLAQKPMIIVPNHLVLQWASEFRTLYPQANLLIATKRDFEKENRLKFVSRIATGDWDAVIMAMSSFEKIPISQERREKKIREEILGIRERLDEARAEENSRLTVKIMEKVLKDRKATLKELSESKKDGLIRFEDLGVDYLFVDEAHKFKNKFIFTKMSNVAGVSQAASKRSSDLDMKIDYLSELHKGQKGVVFATGTPISNSMVEMYTMQSYLQRQDLTEMGLHVFDHWAANFGITVSALELAPSGQGYRSKTRFAKFTNLPELLRMYRKFADVKTADMLKLPVPKANKHVVTIKPTDTVLELCEIIANRAERINDGGVPPEVDNMLKITGDGRKLALDPRCFDSAAPDNPDHKVNICAENIYRIWKDTAEKRGTQLVFCDLSTPKTAYEDYDPDKNFDVYNHVKTALVQTGVPANEIAFIHEAGNDVAKQTLFDNVRAGKVRILIGSTEKCGAGTNVQNRLVALHHLDTPYRPSDLEQREGRAIRQGNGNAEVDIYTYVTERTFDAYSYQILENKQRFIAQVNTGELTVREAADIDETTLTYAEIKAITSANPLIKRKNEVENELGNLQVLEGQYRKNRYALQDRAFKTLPQTIAEMQGRIGEYGLDIVLRDGNKTGSFAVTVAGKPYTERKDAAELLHRLICSPANADKAVAVYKGFGIIPEQLVLLTDRTVILRGNGDHRLSISESAAGTMTRIDNALEGLEDGLKALNGRLEAYAAESEAAKAELEKPFEHARRVIDLTSELEKINAELNLDNGEIDIVIDDAKFQNEVSAETGDADESGDGDNGDDGGKRPVDIPEREAERRHDYDLE
ncbi:MAG: DEAD/DEAH box helicase family protein [Clostridiales bacterium]|nr:DEAD/DEAH box helicase family protein [Clostridiales bacterium]